MTELNAKFPLPIRVGVVEDKETFRKHLAALIAGADGFACVGEHPSAESALKHLARERPDVLVLDLELPELSGDDAIRAFKAQPHPPEILVLTVHKDPQRIFKALEAGASGYLTKPVAPARLLEGVVELRGGGAPMSAPIARLVIQTFHQRGSTTLQAESLSPRETEILQLLAQGYPSKEIAERSRIAVSTVSSHLHKIYGKLHVRSRTEALAKVFGR